MKTNGEIYESTILYTTTTFVSNMHRGAVETKDGKLDKISFEELFIKNKFGRRLDVSYSAKTFKAFAKMITSMDEFLVKKFGENYGD